MMENMKYRYIIQCKAVVGFSWFALVLENRLTQFYVISEPVSIFLIAAQVNDLEYRKSHRRSSAQLYSSKLQSRQSDLEVTAAPNVPPRLGDNYERMQQQNPEDGKLKSPVVLKMIDLTSELQKASQALRLPDVSAHGEAASAPEETGQSDSNVDNDLIRFDDTA